MEKRTELPKPFPARQKGMPIRRKADDFIEHFFQTDRRRALLLTGARQAGKTYAVRTYARAHFKHFVEINFIENPEAATVFTNARNAQDMLLRISALAREPLEKGRTLIFFDEVQRCPEVVTAIKFLVDEGSFRYVLSGSLLGVELKNIRSVPVGYMAVKELYPLDLEEFALACGVNKDVIAALRRSFDTQTAVDALVHARMMDVFRLYLIIGGMPAAVEAYLRTNDLNVVIGIQEQILALYRQDIAQYDPDRKLYIQEIFDLIAPELNAKNKRFILKNLNENLKFSRYENSFLWLKDAGVALPVYNVETPVSPLVLSRSRNLFKLFLSDIGLLSCQYAGGMQLRILNGEADINFGAVYENAVAQELKAHGFDLYYFNSKKQGELDFVIEKDGAALPIEVKSGKDYERHNALRNVLATEQYGIPAAYVLHNGNVARKGSVTYLPMYMTMFLAKDDRTGQMLYTLNLDGLQ